MRENCTLRYDVNHPQQLATLRIVNRFDFFNLVGILFFFFFLIDRNSGRTIFFNFFIDRNSGRTIFFNFFIDRKKISTAL